VVLYGCEIWSLTLKEEHVFENRVLRRIFVLKRDEVTGDWRKLRIEELHKLCSSSSIIIKVKEDEMGRACSRNVGEEECMQDFGGKIGKDNIRKTKT
jgi:hypothetical protein